MNTQYVQDEMLSALADGELTGDQLDLALVLCDREGGREAWHNYHLIGDMMRSPGLARPTDTHRLLQGVRAAMKQENPSVIAAIAQLPAPLAPTANAANDSTFRWKMVAGFASLAAVAAIGWSSLGELRNDASQGAQLASIAPAFPINELAEDGRIVQVDNAPQVMIRDPRLDELLAAHKQFGGVNALQMPAGFLRNATFETTPQQ